MITSSSIPYISQMLNEPHSLSDADIDSIVALTESYPYFVPARYMEAASHHKHSPFDKDMLNNMQLYMGNWIVFHEYMQTANGGAYVTAPPIMSEVAEADPVEESVSAPSLESIWSQEEDEEEMIAGEEEEVIEATEEPALSAPMPEADYDEAYLDEEKEEVNPMAIFEEEEEDESAIISLADEDEHMAAGADNDEALILPIYTEDYFLHQGIQVSNNIPNVDKQTGDLIPEANEEDPKSLMIVMSYTDWLMHFKTHGEKAREEEQDQKALKTMWQKEKLAAALEEENEEIPENVFEMAVNSISREDGLASEALADIYTKQGKYDAAVDMYKKLSLRNPQKSAYFARKVEEILKEKQP